MRDEKRGFLDLGGSPADEPARGHDSSFVREFARLPSLRKRGTPLGGVIACAGETPGAPQDNRCHC